MSYGTVRNGADRVERPAAAVGRLPGHSRRRHRLRHPRRHPGQLGRSTSASPARSSGPSAAPASPGFCFGIIIGGVVVDKIGYGKLVVAAFLFHVLSAVHHVRGDQGTVAGDGLLVSLHRHVRLRAGERHPRSGGQSACLHALPAQPHALPEHPPRELAGGAGARRPGGLDSRGGHAGELEGAARPLPRADGALRPGLHGPALPEIGGVRRRA